MRLTTAQIAQFEREGYLFFPNLFSREEIKSLLDEVPALYGCLPLGLAHGWKVLRPVAAGQPVRWSDVAFDAASTAVRVRREMEQIFGETARA